jgi:tocopherol cyclase
MAHITLKHALVSIIFAFVLYIFSINYQLIIANVKLIYKPTFYHGKRINKNFFEGWYYKTVTSKAEESLIVIPGIYKSASQSDGQSHAFVMIIRDGYECLYYRFNINEFSVENSGFTIKIGQSEFSENIIGLSLPSTKLIPTTDIEYELYVNLVVKDWKKILGRESDFSSLKKSIIKHPFIPYSVRGYISFNNTTPYPFTYSSPTVMGPFTYIPFLECNHGVVSMSHKSSGIIEFVNMKHNGIVENRIDLENGFGYIEKDWGVNFPKSWIWSQSNTFISEMKEEKSSSILISVADFPLISPDNPLYNVPFLRSFLSLFHLAGRIIVFYHAKSDTTYNFSTYEFSSKIVNLEITMDNFVKQYVKLHAVNTANGLNLEINIKSKAGSGIPLRIPSKQFGKMTLMIEESLDAELHVKLWKSGENSKEEVIFNDRAVAGGLEIVGDVMRLVNKFNTRKN